MMESVTHDGLAHDLAKYLKNDNRMVWENIPAGMAGSVRPDVFTIQKSFANPNPTTYEVKVTESDFRSDITSGKWRAYLDFSYAVIFAVPKGLITKKDLPRGCGLITYSGAGLWHTVKKPTLSPCALSGELLLKLLIGGAARMTELKPIHCRDFDRWREMDKLRKKFGKDIAEKIALIEEYPKMKKELKALKKELGSVLEIDVDRWCFESDAEHKIKELKVMADETEGRAAIAKELERLKVVLSKNLDNTIRDFV